MSKNIFSDNRDTLIYPNVLASTKMGDPTPEQPDAPAFVEFVTNDQDTVVRGYVYWYFPPEGAEERTPVLMIEIDDEDEGRDTMDVKIRVRRNDGLVYEGDRADQENPPTRISNKEARELLDCIKQAQERTGDWLVALERAHALAVAVVEDTEAYDTGEEEA